MSLFRRSSEKTSESRQMAETLRPAEESHYELKGRIHRQLIEGLDLSKVALLPADVVQQQIRRIVEDLLAGEETPLNRQEREQIVVEVQHETFGLGPIEPLMQDPTVSDILINGPRHVYVERRGKLERTTVIFRDDAHLMQVIERIVSAVGRRVDESSPLVDARLADGSRVNAIIPPLALDGPILSIRRFATEPLRIRKRYMRGSTVRNGQTLPLTSMTSPKYSPIQVTPGMSLVGYRNVPSVLNCLS